MRTWLSNITVFTCCSAALFLSFIFTPAPAQNDVTYSWQTPDLNGYRVHDEAKILRPETIQQLEKQLKEHQDSTSNQIAILTLSKLMGSLESYSLKVANEWKLGQKGKNNGVLILVVKDDHKIRIEVGKGLEGVLTNNLCSQIISNEMAPNFREKNYDAGMVAAVSAIIKGIGGTYTGDYKPGFIYEILVIVGYCLVVILSIIGLISRDYFPATFGGLLPFHGMFALFGFTTWWVLLGFVAGLPLLRLVILKSKIKLLNFGNVNTGKREEDLYDQISRRTRRRGASSSDSSDDSFSGGGGSFGGRGSSGSW